MRSLPADLDPERLTTALAEQWHLPATSMQYVPEGGGSYHWKHADERGQAHFVTVDDLDTKDWLGDARDERFCGLRRALGTAAALRYAAGLEFVLAPIPAVDGAPLRRLDDRYTVSVYPFLSGRSYPFGCYRDAELRSQALSMIAALHQASPHVQDRAPQHVPAFQGRADLAAFLLEPGRPWHAGPFSEAARQLLAKRAADIAQLAAGFDRLVDETAPARASTVVTHGEPHPANLLSVGDRVLLIDWDTVALAPAERDVCLIAAADEPWQAGSGARSPWSDGAIDRYHQVTGRALDLAVLTLYRLRWYLDDVASAISMFRSQHRDTNDTRRWLDSIGPQLSELPGWLELLG